MYENDIYCTIHIVSDWLGEWRYGGMQKKIINNKWLAVGGLVYPPQLVVLGSAGFEPV